MMSSEHRSLSSRIVGNPGSRPFFAPLFWEPNQLNLKGPSEMN